MSDEVMLLLDEAPGGAYKLSRLNRFELDEDWDTESSLVGVKKERGKLVVGEKTAMVTIHVEHINGARLPYLKLSDLRAL